MHSSPLDGWIPPPTELPAQSDSESDSDDESAVPVADSFPLVGFGDSREVEPSEFLLAQTDSWQLLATTAFAVGSFLLEVMSRTNARLALWWGPHVGILSVVLFLFMMHPFFEPPELPSKGVIRHL